jgi:hypothetical protein
VRWSGWRGRRASGWPGQARRGPSRGWLRATCGSLLGPSLGLPRATCGPPRAASRGPCRVSLGSSGVDRRVNLDPPAPLEAQRAGRAGESFVRHHCWLLAPHRQPLRAGRHFVYLRKRDACLRASQSQRGACQFAPAVHYRCRIVGVRIERSSLLGPDHAHPEPEALMGLVGGT